MSLDSRLFYRGMDIGTAKPTLEEMRRVPHHLIDVSYPDEDWSLRRFQKAANHTIMDIHTRGKLPFLVGGTGQYARAIVEGWVPPAVRPHPQMRNVLEGWSEEIGNQGIHQRLAALDPKAAARIDYRNLRRTIRALEVILTTGERFSAQRRKGDSTYNTLILGLTRPRDELYQRIDDRLDAMLASGFVEEVQGLLKSGYPPDLPAFSAIGYPQIIAYLQGEQTLEEATAEVRRATRIYVRRQANWFKPTDPEIHWYRVKPGVVNAMEAHIRKWLSEQKGGFGNRNPKEPQKGNF